MPVVGITSQWGELEVLRVFTIQHTGFHGLGWCKIHFFLRALCSPHLSLCLCRRAEGIEAGAWAASAGGIDAIGAPQQGWAAQGVMAAARDCERLCGSQGEG